MEQIIYDFLEKKDMRVQYIKNTESTVLLMDEIDYFEQFEQLLEENGSSWEEFKEKEMISDYDLYENYAICDECGSYLSIDTHNIGCVNNEQGQYICNDCADWSEIINQYKNNVKSCINTDYDDLHYILNNNGWFVYDTYDFEPYDDNYISPNDIIDKINTNKYNYLWVLENNNIFSTRATLYLQVK